MKPMHVQSTESDNANPVDIMLPVETGTCVISNNADKPEQAMNNNTSDSNCESVNLPVLDSHSVNLPVLDSDSVNLPVLDPNALNQPIPETVSEPVTSACNTKLASRTSGRIKKKPQRLIEQM